MDEERTVRRPGVHVTCDSADCTYTVDGDRIVFNWGREVLAFTFADVR